MTTNRNILFIYIFSIIDLLIYSLAFIISDIITESITFPQALEVFASTLILRIVFFQLPIQQILVYFGLKYHLQLEATVFFAASIGFLFTMFFIGRDLSSIWQDMKITSHGIGFGSALLISILSTLAIFRIIPKLSSLRVSTS